MSDNQTEGLNILQLAKQIIPVPYESRPTVSDIYVRYGLDNLYPNFILNLYAKCPIHHAIIDTKSSYIIGDGLKLKGGAEITNFKPNKSESLSEFIDKVVKDFLIHNTITIEVQYNELTYTRGALAYNHIPAHCVRTNKDKSLFWYSENWIYKRQEVIYERWYENNLDPKSKLFWSDGYIPSVNRIYMDPDYTACIESIVTDMSIRLFNRNNITSNFSPSKLITYYLGDNAPKSVQNDIKDKLDKYFSGAGEKYMLIFANPGQDKIKVENIDSNSWDKAYEVTRDAVKEDIYEGHSISASLLGKDTPGKLGATQDFEVRYEIFKSNYVQGKRSQIESALSMLFGFEVEFGDRALFKGRIPDTTKEKIYTINEMRQVEGLPPLPNGDVLLTPSQIGGTNPQIPVKQSLQLSREDFKIIAHLGSDKSLFIKLDDNVDVSTIISETGAPKAIGDINVSAPRVMQVMYEYNERPGLPPLLSEHRAFCEELMNSGKYYARYEIQQMSSIFGYDVYRFGGHWYTQPGGNVTTEQCRHEWNPVVVTRNI